MTFDYTTQPKERIKYCPLCGGQQFWPVSDWDRYGLPVRSVRCHACGLVFLNPRMTRDAYRDFYQNGHYRDLLARFYGRPMDTDAHKPFRRTYSGRVTAMLKQHVGTRRVESLLDVGGSAGYVAEAVAKDLGAEAKILEPAEDEAQEARARGLRVIPGTIEDYEPDGERFGVILLCQTIDHLLDIKGALLTIRALLEDDGLLFVDIVAGGQVKIDHPFYLSRDTATAFLRGAGLGALGEGPGGRHYNFVCEKA